MLSKLNSGVLLGEGTFGKVFLGNDGETAVKIAKDVESSRSIHGEFDVLRKLNHANVIKVHQLNVEVGISFFAMELMDNNLSSFLRQNTRVRLELVENFSKQLFNALHYLAEMSIIHRDVKPSNILVKNPLKLKLSDFGTAIHVESKDRNCGVTTLGYRAPEMILQDKSYGLPVDVWSMGCVVVKMLTGKELFPNRQQNGDEKAQLKAIDEGLLQLDTGICGSSSWLRKILHNTLQMDPHTRWTAYEVLGATLSNSKRPAAEISKVAASDASLLDKYISELQLQNRHDYEEASRTKFEGRISSTETSPDFFLVKVLTASDCGTRITAGTHFDITTMNGVQVLGEVTAIGDDLCNKTISLKIPVSSLPSLPQFAAPPAVCTLQQRYDPTTFDRKLNAVMTAKTRLANDHLTSLKAALLGFSAIVTSPLVVSALFNDTHTNRLHQKQAEALSCALQHKISLIHGPAGTGKTLVGAEIAVCYLRGLVANCSRKLLACAATNMAADLLARKLAANDIRVVLLEARSKEKSCPSSAEYTLHQRVLARLKGALPAAEEPYWGELRVQYANKDRGSKTFNEAVYNTLYRRAEQEILNWAEAVCCTCISAGTKRLNMHSFDSLVLDEANLVSLPELLIPVSRGIERLVLIGDHKQKKPFITMDRTEVPFLAESQFERMLEDHPLTVLNEQARMDPAISKFVSKQCYDSQLIDAPTVLQRPLPADVRGWLSKSKPMLWHHINGTAVTTRSNSQYNPAEITLVVNYIGQLRLEGVLATSIMVIAPYSAQVDHISTALTNTFPDYLVDVRTIDSSEGNENAILLLSLTADQNQFISDPGRFTVALTRGKHQVIVIGDCKAYFRDTTDGTNNDYKDLQRYIADRNGVLKGNFSQAVPAVYYGEGGFTIDRWIPNLCASALATSAGVTKAAVMSALSGLAKSASTAANPLSPVVLPRAAPARLSAATKSAEKEDGEESEESEPEPVPQRPDHIPPAASSAQQQPLHRQHHQERQHHQLKATTKLNQKLMRWFNPCAGAESCKFVHLKQDSRLTLSSVAGYLKWTLTDAQLHDALAPLIMNYFTDGEGVKYLLSDV